MKTQKALFAMGCFWSPQLLFSKVKGVKKTTVGYTGGRTKNPTYKQVCTHTTGHAESILIEFDPKIISYEQLLEIFWENHNPTSKNRQGLNFGSQYRSAIFYFTEKQKSLAQKSKKEHQKTLNKKIVTQIRKASTFYPAEEYHQDYLKKRGKLSCGI